VADHRRRQLDAGRKEMNTRLSIVLLVALLYGGWRALPLIKPAIPVGPVAPAAEAPFPEIAKLAAQMSAEDRSAMRDAYSVLSRSVSADPADEPVFLDVASVRRAHRAALLVVWQGALSNKPGEVAGLREALEGALSSKVGADDVVLNPALRSAIAQAFADIAASFP
jgi:hypothetical protein